MGCTEKHDKIKIGHVKIEMDYKGMLEQIITNIVCYKERKLSCLLLIASDLYYFQLRLKVEKKIVILHSQYKVMQF